MEYSNMTIDQLNEVLKDLYTEATTMVAIFDKNIDIKTSLRSRDIFFSIQHRDMNWSEFIGVTITDQGVASFSHGSGSWNSKDHSQESIMNMSIELFFVAKSIMNMHENLSDILKKIGRVLNAISVIKINEEQAAYKTADTECKEYLNSNFIKADSKSIMEVIKKTGRVELIRSGAFDSKNNKINTSVFCVCDMGHGYAGRRLNLYMLENHDNIVSTNSYSSQTKISKYDLESFNHNTYFYQETQEIA